MSEHMTNEQKAFYFDAATGEVSRLKTDLARVTNERREYWRERLVADGVLVSSEQLARVTAERDRYHDALIARHGGEPIALLAELDAERARVADYESRLSSVMPPDFKDWHQNARSEWPVVAALVIENLRARVAELERDFEMQTTRCIEREDRLAQAEVCIRDRERRNAELVVALRDANASVQDALPNIGAWENQCPICGEHVDCGDFTHKPNCAAVTLPAALARAESSTQAVVQDSLTTGATPSKHPDTERLDWLLANGDPLVAWINTDSIVVESRAAIDAARKQGGSER